MIWAPLLVLTVPCAVLGALLKASWGDEFSAFVQVMGSGSFGVAAVWLLGAWLARRGRALAFAFMTLAMAALGLLAFVSSPIWEEIWDARDFVPLVLLWTVLAWTVCGLVFAGAIAVTGFMCRHRYSGLRFLVRLPIWLFVTWTSLVAVAIGVTALGSGEKFQWVPFIGGSVVLTATSFAMLLPFVILSLTTSLYRERLKCLLRLPATEAAPPPATPPSVAEPITRT